MSRQISFNFLIDTNYSADNFIVFNENIDAFCYINNKSDSNNQKDSIIFLNGESKCGKTHLGQIWKQKHNAKNINISEFYTSNFDDFIIRFNKLVDNYNYYILDDFPTDIDEHKFLFILNAIMSSNSNILIISNFDFRDKIIEIKDLKSRIEAAVHLKINSLSKDIKPMLINKLFADRQVFIDSVILNYLNDSLPTNYHDIFNFVEKIFDNLNAGKGVLNIDFVKKIMDNNYNYI